MGYGVKDPNRRWPHTITYEGTASEDVCKALTVWQRKLGSIQFVPADGATPALFKIVTTPSGSCIWRSGDTINGRCPDKQGQLALSENAKFGAILHEIGHLLGLAHEQDRQHCDQAKAWCADLLQRDGGLFALMLEAAGRKNQHYQDIGAFNSKSIMLYGNGYENWSEVSQDDADAVLAIHGAGGGLAGSV